MAKMAGCLTLEEEDGMVCATFKIVGATTSPDIKIGAILAPLIMDDSELKQQFEDLMTAAVGKLMTEVCGMAISHVEVIKAGESRH